MSGRRHPCFLLDGQRTAGYEYVQPFLVPTHDPIRHPMSYTLGTAAKATGKSKSTIQRAIKSGRISAYCDASGVYTIDPSELHRVFAPVPANRLPQPALEPSATPDETPFLRREIERVAEERERERRQMQETINDLRCRLDEEMAERRKLTTLLTHHPLIPPAPARKAGWLSRLFIWKGHPS